MNLLDKIKADIARHEVMACHDLDGQLASIDVQALSQLLGNDGEPSYSVDNGTATIKVRGLLIPQARHDYGDSVTGYDVISGYLQQASDNQMVNSIVLDIDSQGGYAQGLSQVIEQIDGLTKPIRAYVSGNAYSAGYWLASSTEHITATKNSGVGSIGVMVQHVEESERLKKEGLKITTFVSGIWKDFFSSTRPLTEQESQRIQKNIDESASTFFNFVAYKRGLDVATVADWQGDAFNATKALEMGLIDSIKSGSTRTATNPQVPTTTKAESSATHPNPQEIDMDLVQALAENSNLKGQVAEKEFALQARDSKIAELQKALSEQKATARQSKIDELAQATGKAFSDDEVTAFKSMDEAGFNLVASLATAKPTLPKGLNLPQATAGAVNETQTLSGKITAWEQQ